jgi:hypothetical protein
MKYAIVLTTVKLKVIKLSGFSMGKSLLKLMNLTKKNCRITSNVSEAYEARPIQ